MRSWESTRAPKKGRGSDSQDRLDQKVDADEEEQSKRDLIERFEQRDQHDGALWGIGTEFANYGLSNDPLDCVTRVPDPLAKTPTRLKAMDDVLQEMLINWGYAVSDATLRRYSDDDLQQRYGVTIASPKGFPYSRGYWWNVHLTWLSQPSPKAPGYPEYVGSSR